MTVSLTSAEVKLLGNNSTTVFSLGLELYDETYVTVTRWTNNVSTLLTLNVDYSLSDIQNELGATLTYPLVGAPLASGSFLYVKRVTPTTQTTDGNLLADIDPAATEDRFDLLTMAIQELKAAVARALSMATSVSPNFAEIPNAFFGTDAQGKPTLLTTTPATVTVVSGIVVWESDTVAALVADTDLGYSGGATVVVAAGNIVRAGGYRYQVVASGAATYDLQTAGGVRVLALDMELDAFNPAAPNTAVSNFLIRVKSNYYGFVNPGTFDLAGKTVSTASYATIKGTINSIWRRAAATVNLLTFGNPVHVNISGLNLNGQWSTHMTNGHGLVLIDPDHCIVTDFTSTDFGGADMTNGGAGLLAYPANGLDKLEGNIVGFSRFVGRTNSVKSFGMVQDNSNLGVTFGCTAEKCERFGLEYKNASTSNVLVASTGALCRNSFGLGFEGAQIAKYNVFAALASQDSDIAMLIGQGERNIVMGLNVVADTPPDTYGNSDAYGLHIETDSHENLAIGLLTSGSALNYPVRIRGNKNAVSFADHSSAARSVTFNAGAAENYVELLHIGDKAVNIKGLIEDQNSPIILKGPGANVVDSPPTREYYGSTTDAFTWGLDGYDQAYTHFSTTGFRFEGNLGQTVLGLGVKDTKEAGLRIATTAVEDEGAFTYQMSATPYWRWDVDETQVMRLDTQALKPLTDGLIDLGTSAITWGDAFVQGLRIKPSATPIPTVNETLTFVRINNTSIQLNYKGSDGVTRTTTLTFS